MRAVEWVFPVGGTCSFIISGTSSCASVFEGDGQSLAAALFFVWRGAKAAIAWNVRKSQDERMSLRRDVPVPKEMMLWRQVRNLHSPGLRMICPVD